MKKRIQSEPHAINCVEIPQEVIELFFERIILPKLVDEFLAAESEAVVDTGDIMEPRISPGGAA